MPTTKSTADRDPIVETIALNLAELIREKKTTAPAVAASAGLNRTIVYDILGGKSRAPSIVTLAKIATALGVDLSEILVAPRSHDESVALELTGRRIAAELARLDPERRAELESALLAILGASR